MRVIWIPAIMSLCSFVFALPLYALPWQCLFPCVTSLREGTKYFLSTPVSPNAECDFKDNGLVFEKRKPKITQASESWRLYYTGEMTVATTK